MRLILEGIEEQYRKIALAEENVVPPRLTIEHVLPQSWEAHWPLPTNTDIEQHGKIGTGCFIRLAT